MIFALPVIPEVGEYELGQYNYNSPIYYAYIINLGKGSLELYCHCALMGAFSLEELFRAPRDECAHLYLRWRITDDLT
jgi:hypothetical protein